MIIRTYKAATLEEAMTNAKAELGPNTILLHQKNIRKGGFLCFGGKKTIEATVALVLEEPQIMNIKN